MIEWTDEDVQAAHEAFKRSWSLRAALDAALASALKREAASVPQDEVEVFREGIGARVAASPPFPSHDEWIAAGIAALDAYRAGHSNPVAWIEGPHGAIRANPLHKFSGPGAFAWSFPLYTHPAPAPQIPTPTDEQIHHMVSRFLGWPLPVTFCPDTGISFDPAYNKGTPHEGRHNPSGTNLLNAEQAEAMVRYMIEGVPMAAPQIHDHGKLWSFLRSVMFQGADIQKDYAHGKFARFEAYSARMDVAASTRTDELERLLAAAPKPGDDHE